MIRIFCIKTIKQELVLAKRVDHFPLRTTLEKYQTMKQKFQVGEFIIKCKTCFYFPKERETNDFILKLYLVVTKKLAKTT